MWESKWCSFRPPFVLLNRFTVENRFTQTPPLPTEFDFEKNASYLQRLRGSNLKGCLSTKESNNDSSMNAFLLVFQIRFLFQELRSMLDRGSFELCCRNGASCCLSALSVFAAHFVAVVCTIEYDLASPWIFEECKTRNTSFGRLGKHHHGSVFEANGENQWVERPESGFTAQEQSCIRLWGFSSTCRDPQRLLPLSAFVCWDVSAASTLCSVVNDAVFQLKIMFEDQRKSRFDISHNNSACVPSVIRWHLS